jgi:methyltransferase (TIGR00027 family)
MEAISRTAQWMAAIRAKEARRASNRLFDDPFAAALAAPNGDALLDRYRAGSVEEFVAIRTRFFDDAIARLVTAPGIDQVVLVAAGMDTRAFRLSWPAGVTVFEIDHGSLLTVKATRLAEARARPRVKRVEVHADLAQPWIDTFRAHGFDPSRPTLWVAEALVFYLSEDEVSALLRQLRRLSAPGSWLLLDFPNAALLRSPLTRRFLDVLANDGVPWRFGADDPGAFLERAGWRTVEIKQPGEPGAAFGRWPHPIPTAAAAGVPRTWLIAASSDAATGAACLP